MRTVAFSKPPSIIGVGSIVGKKEGEGPLAEYFDKICTDLLFGEKSWELAESKFLQSAIGLALESAHLNKVDVMLSGDLINQCCSSAFAAREVGFPLFGIYGACSTFGEGMLLGSMLVSAGYFDTALFAASSHFCSAEKQFRTPLEYGGQRTPTAQWTVTGAGAAILSLTHEPPFVTHITVGRLRDRGITDPNNMGAAMAPAFADTIVTHFKETGRMPSDYDMILSGDLGSVGKKLAIELVSRAGYDISKNYEDCGCLMFDADKQDVHAGGSGCACSATVFCAYILDKMEKGEINQVLFAPTGAMLSSSSTLQGESIPGISYAAAISMNKVDYSTD